MIEIKNHTTKNPISMIGEMAGVCWGADTFDQEKNYKRGLDCLQSKHGRTFEFPDVYMVIDDYSARVIRELYTHNGGSPTRLQASTRYIDYQNGFDYVTPKSIKINPAMLEIYTSAMQEVVNNMQSLEMLGTPREDIAMLLPLGMTTKVVGKYNLRTLLDMAQQRKCTRAYWEFRELFKELEKELSNYSDEWKYLVDNFFLCKCDITKSCSEKHSCGKYFKIMLDK